jgi:hypothetical protein
MIASQLGAHAAMQKGTTMPQTDSLTMLRSLSSLWSLRWVGASHIRPGLGFMMMMSTDSRSAWNPQAASNGGLEAAANLQECALVIAF